MLGLQARATKLEFSFEVAGAVIDKIYFICTCVHLTVCMYMNHVHTCACLQRSKEEVGSPGTGVTVGSCEPHHLMWMLGAEPGSSVRVASPVLLRIGLTVKLRLVWNS